MNSLKDNPSANRRGDRRASERRLLPFFIEFVKFTTGFAVIVAAALLALHVATAAIG